MIDVVKACATHIKLKIDEVVEGRENILMREGADRIGNREPQLFIDLVTANTSKVVTLGVKESGLQQLLATTHRRWFPWTQLFIELQERLILGANALVVRGLDRFFVVLGVPELVDNIVVGKSHRTHQNVSIDFACFIDANMQQVIFICLKLQPSPTIGDNTCVVSTTTVLILLILEIDARTTNDLINNYPLGTINDERSTFSH